MGYNQSNNGNYLENLTAVLNSDVEGTNEAVIVWAAGNAGTDITSTLVNELNIHPIGNCAEDHGREPVGESAPAEAGRFV